MRLLRSFHNDPRHENIFPLVELINQNAEFCAAHTHTHTHHYAQVCTQIQNTKQLNATPEVFRYELTNDWQIAQYSRRPSRHWNRRSTPAKIVTRWLIVNVSVESETEEAPERAKCFSNHSFPVFVLMFWNKFFPFLTSWKCKEVRALINQPGDLVSKYQTVFWSRHTMSSERFAYITENDKLCKRKERKKDVHCIFDC